ncbi:hypothetical protein Clacol_005220 [Clathrus columnatus]|uniref:Uncharacterized protein n=1 Tax=Clathrus columnatus TaxID=1419009 RepID=A0AAV5ADB0_9AGAM|nr:hypothetical protein Clacol_005220 [Clathrus columnatus]
MTRHEEVVVADSKDVSEVLDQLPEKKRYSSDDSKLEASVDIKEQDIEDRLYDHNGKEKVLETPADFATALVSLEDDPTMPVNTFRMWFSGIGLAVFGAVLAMLFQFRPQVIDVSPLFLQLLAYMFGRFFEVAIPGPGSRFHTGSRFWNFMNPGPFNIKEHVASQIMANTASVAATACFVFAADDLFYNINVNNDAHAFPGTLKAGNAIFTLLASQLIGYGFAGMFRSFLVYPTAMLYPQNLIYVNLFDVLHRSKGELLQGKRLRFFWTVVLVVFVYEWFPERAILPAIGNPDIHLRGLGDELHYPTTCLKLPNSDFSLNRTAFDLVGQPWQSGSSVIYSLGINLSIGATFVHIGLWYGKEIWQAFYDYIKGKPNDDPHYKKMLKYLPVWWYALITVIVVCAYTEHSQLPWWALIVALIIAVITLPFYGAMKAISAWTPVMANLFQILGAALIPGSSQANMYFELYSSRALTQATAMLSDLKLGQYTKLPPRWTFTVQVAGTIVGALLNYVIMQTVVNNERDILLSNEGTRVWSGQQIQSFNANAILWGALGKEIYGPHGPYFIVPIGIVIGLVLPVLPWLLYKKFGWHWLVYVNTAVLAYNIGDLAGGTNGYINTWMVIGLTSHFYIRKYKAGWFRKYNYLFGAAIDGGAQIFVFIFSFALAGAGGRSVPFPEWALNPKGNAVSSSSATQTEVDSKVNFESIGLLQSNELTS